MVDTVLLKIHEPLSQPSVDSLESPKTTVDERTGEVRETSGYVRSLRVTTTRTETLLQGSVAKAVLGHNFSVADPSQTAGLLEEVSEVLGVDLLSANVYRLDFGLCAILPVPLGAVVPYLGPSKGYDLDTFRGGKTGVSYGSGKERRFNIYDKVSELKSKNRRAKVPDGFEGQHVTRFEVQLKRNVGRQIKQEVYGRTLTEPSFHGVMLDRLWEEVEAVQWGRTSFGRLGNDWPEYRRVLAFEGLMQRGLTEEIARIRANRDSGEYQWSRNMDSKLIRYIRDLSQSEELSSEPDVASQARHAFRRAMRDYGEVVGWRGRP